MLPFHGKFGRFWHRRSLARWKEARARAGKIDFASLDRLGQMAHQILRDVGRFKVAADEQLSLPRAGAAAIPKPPGTDWAWRPAPWQSRMSLPGHAPARSKDSLTNDVVLFHDCQTAEVIARQVKNMRDIDLSLFGIEFEIFHFDGNYLSLVIEVPPTSCDKLRKSHLLRLSAVITHERPTRIDARLNVKHGPNVEQVLMTLPDAAGEVFVEFDLAYSQLIEARAERMWIDLMIAAPAMNRITFHDIHLCRYPRAAL